MYAFAVDVLLSTFENSSLGLLSAVSVVPPMEPKFKNILFISGRNFPNPLFSSSFLSDFDKSLDNFESIKFSVWCNFLDVALTESGMLDVDTLVSLVWPRVLNRHDAFQLRALAQYRWSSGFFQNGSAW